MVRKGTSLCKALIFEKILPWRCSNLLRKTFYKFYNINTKRYWNSRFKKIDSNQDWKRRTELFKLNLEYMPNNKKITILDVGCAAGEACKLYSEKIPLAKIEGCDFSEIAVQKSKELNPTIHFFRADIRKEEIQKKYDYIILTSVLEHFRYPNKIIKKCLKKTNKTLIINCPYGHNNEREHLSFFQEKSLAEFKAFEKIKKTKYYGKRIIYVIKK